MPAIVNGSKQVDGGFLVLSDAERAELLKLSPEAEPYVRPFVGSEEFINGTSRWCLWLVDAPPALLRKSGELLRRVEGVRAFRLASKKEKTRGSAATPTLFGEIRPVTTNFLAIPEVSSERRFYIPIGFLPPRVIPSNKIQVVPEATPYHFGMLSSAMHMAWMRQVTGRMKSDYSYSAKIVYNNYPWPPSPTAKQKEAVEAAAQKVLDVRAQFLAPVGQTSDLPVKGASGSQSQTARAGTGSAATPPEQALTGRPEVRPTKTASLADLYDPLSMPPALVKAHATKPMRNWTGRWICATAPNPSPASGNGWSTFSAFTSN